MDFSLSAILIYLAAALGAVSVLVSVAGAKRWGETLLQRYRETLIDSLPDAENHASREAGRRSQCS